MISKGRRQRGGGDDDPPRDMWLWSHLEGDATKGPWTPVSERRLRKRRKGSESGEKALKPTERLRKRYKDSESDGNVVVGQAPKETGRLRKLCPPSASRGLARPRPASRRSPAIRVTVRGDHLLVRARPGGRGTRMRRVARVRRPGVPADGRAARRARWTVGARCERACSARPSVSRSTAQFFPLKGQLGRRPSRSTARRGPRGGVGGWPR